MSDLATIEDRLRRTYQAVADTTVLTGGDELPDPSTLHLLDLRGRDGGQGFDFVDLSDDRSPHRRRFLLTAAATLAVAALGAASIVVSGGTDEPAAQTGGSFTSGWSALPESPLGARNAHAAVWTGEEMLVFGGDVERDSGDPAEGAAAYSPTTNTWREIAEPPEHLRGAVLAVWTGDVVVAFPEDQTEDRGDAADGEQPGAVYDPDEDTWTEIPTSGVGVVTFGTQVFWTGDRVVVVGMVDPADPDGAMGRAALYDPATDTWERVDDAPLVLGQAFGGWHAPDAVWTGEEVLYVGIVVDDPSGSSSSGSSTFDTVGDRLGVLALDPASGTWRELPAPPLSVRFGSSVVWTGSELLIAGGSALADEAELYDGAILDPATGTWQPLPELPGGLRVGEGGDTGSAVLAGGKLVFLQTWDTDDRPVIFDPATRSWFLGEPHPHAVFQPVTVSIGDTVLLWGGSESAGSGADVATGYAYTP
jgi:hypothetical protein